MSKGLRAEFRATAVQRDAAMLCEMPLPLDPAENPEHDLELGRVLLAAYQAGKVSKAESPGVLRILGQLARHPDLTREQRQEFAAALETGG